MLISCDGVCFGTTGACLMLVPTFHGVIAFYQAYTNDSKTVFKLASN